MLKNVEWIFFDVGTTLIDESIAYNHRIKDVILGTDITFDEFVKARIESAKQNCSDGMEVLNYFGFEKTPWHKEDEIPYKESVDILQYLNEYGYKIGIIANQSAGTQERLEQWGMMKYINLVVSSAEEGVCKPDEAIFCLALKKAECTAENAVMIGDRLDNDIYPAKKLGMKAIWIKQGFAKYQTLCSDDFFPDYIIYGLDEIKSIFM